MKKRINLFLFFLVILLGFAIRTTYLSKYPPSLNWDEVSHGYNAYSLIKTGRDEWGKLFPISNFRAYGDYPLTLTPYLTIPFIAIFGLSEFAIRMPHAVLGTLTIIASYYLAYGLTKSRKTSLLASLFVALEPWHFFSSRFVVQSNLSVFFLTASVAAFVNRKKNIFLLPISLLFLGLTLYSYHTTRIFSPFILVIVAILYREDLVKLIKPKKHLKTVLILITTLFFLPLPFILANPESRARSSEVFLIDEGAVNTIIQKRVESHYPMVVNRLIYNRPVYFAVEAVKNYIGYFSPQFLFIRGGTHYQFSIPGKGLAYISNIIFFYLGAYIVFKNAFYKKKDYMLIAIWFLLAPIPASITKENFAVIRASTMLPLPQLFSAIGAVSFFDYLRKKLNLGKAVYIAGWTAYIIFFFTNVESYMIEYFGDYTINYSQDWQYGYKEAVSYIRTNYDKYDKIIITKKYGEPHEFLLFYWPWDPKSYQEDENLIRFGQSDWYWVDRFDKFYFVNDWEIPRTQNEDFVLESGGNVPCSPTTDHCLLITSPRNFPKGWKKLKTINFLNNKPAFELYGN